ncbi:ydjO [Escherichia coli]|nr:ydjO [Escherichia coli]
MMSLWDALRMNMMISYQELIRTFPNIATGRRHFLNFITIPCYTHYEK